MVARSWHLALFSLCLIFTSGLSTSYGFGTQLDDVPIVNPTTPGTDNPYPTVNQPPPQTPDTTPTTANPTTPTNNPTSSGGQWCVAKQGVPDKDLQVALDYACGYGGADCSQIQPGASCYDPNTVRDHASYAFNDYYQKNPIPTSCDFSGTATVTTTDPSHGNCRYASPKTTSTSSPPPPPTYVSPPSPLTPPLTPTPPDMSGAGGGSTVYGAEPTGSPNAATSAFNPLLMLVTSGLLDRRNSGDPLQIAKCEDQHSKPYEILCFCFCSATSPSSHHFYQSKAKRRRTKGSTAVKPNSVGIN